MIQVSIFSMLLIIIILHTIFSHVFNWIFRKVSRHDEPFAVIIIMLMLIEAVVIVKLFQYFLN